jgi:hypothetical protein
MKLKNKIKAIISTLLVGTAVNYPIIFANPEKFIIPEDSKRFKFPIIEEYFVQFL